MVSFSCLKEYFNQQTRFFSKRFTFSSQAEDEEGQKYFQSESRGESMWEHPSQVFLPIQNMSLAHYDKAGWSCWVRENPPRILWLAAGTSSCCFLFPPCLLLWLAHLDVRVFCLLMVVVLFRLLVLISVVTLLVFLQSALILRSEQQQAE